MRNKNEATPDNTGAVGQKADTHGRGRNPAIIAEQCGEPGNRKEVKRTAPLDTNNEIVGDRDRRTSNDNKGRSRAVEPGRETTHTTQGLIETMQTTQSIQSSWEATKVTRKTQADLPTNAQPGEDNHIDDDTPEVEVRVCLLQSVELLPGLSAFVPVRVEGNFPDNSPLLIELVGAGMCFGSVMHCYSRAQTTEDKSYWKILWDSHKRCRRGLESGLPHLWWSRDKK